MGMHPDFADWYRSATLTPPDGLLEKRWAGVEDMVKQPNAASLLACVRLFALSQATEGSVPAGMRDTFRAHDATFPSRDNIQELRVLAGAALRIVIEQDEEWSPLAALALVCGLFGPREAAVLERGHLDAAQRFILEYARSTREAAAPAPIKVPTFSKTKFAETLPQTLFGQNQLPQVHEPLLNTLTEIASGLSAALKQAQEAIEQLTSAADVREEEVAVLWWLQSRYSRELQKSFSEIGYTAGSFVFPMEVADLTRSVPGSESVVAVLVHALQLAGAPSSAEPVSIASATNALPREWREKVSKQHKIDATELLTPLLMAIQKSLDTESHEDWFPVYRKACDVPLDRPIPIVHLSLQLFRERMLLRAVNEAK